VLCDNKTTASIAQVSTARRRDPDPVQSVRDLGIFIDADLVIPTHVQRTVSRCFAVLRGSWQLRSIRYSVPTTTFQTYRLAGTVEAGLRKCRFGRSSGLYSSPTSVGDERSSTAHLRSASHRPQFGCTHHPPLAPAQERVLFKMAVLMYKASHGATPL